jgi:hypothetical protein
MPDQKREELEALLGTIPREAAERIRELIADPTTLLAGAARVTSARASSVGVGRVQTGVWRARGLCAEELKLDLRAQGVALENSRVDLHIDVEVGFQFPRLGGTGPRILKAGPAPGRVSTPTLKKIDLSSLTRQMGLSFVLSSVCTQEATAEVAPIERLELGVGQLFNGVARDLALSLATEQTLGARGLTLESMKLPPTEAREVSVDALGAEERLRASDVALRGASIPSAVVGNVRGGELDLDFEIHLPKMKVKTFPDMPAIIERLVTRFWVEITPTIVMHIGNILLDGLVISTEVETLKIDELSLPLVLERVDAQGVTLGSLEISSVKQAERER